MPSTHDDDTRMDAQAPGRDPAREPDAAPEGISPEDAVATDVARPSVKGRVAKPRKPKKGKPAKEKKAKKATKAAADEAARDRRPRKPGRARRVLLALVLLVLAAILVGTGLFCWQKWLRYDDAADIQGVWKVRSTGDTIVFDGRNLKITKGIAYEYRLDTDGKTIAYAFGGLEGGGRYYFAADRETLVIVDGDGRLDALAEAGFISEEVLADRDASDETTVLAKVSDDTSAEPSGTATGIGKGAATGEREYVVKPESSSSSGSKKKDASSSASSSSEKRGGSSAEGSSARGFVDEDGDGYDDETGLEYGDFLDYQEQRAGQKRDGEGGVPGGFVDEDEDGYDDATGLDYEDYLQAYGEEGGPDYEEGSMGGADGEDDDTPNGQGEFDAYDSADYPEDEDLGYDGEAEE